MFPHFSYSKSLDRRQAAKNEKNHADAEETDMDRLPKKWLGVKELIIIISQGRDRFDKTGLGYLGRSASAAELADQCNAVSRDSAFSPSTSLGETRILDRDIKSIT